MYVKPERPLGVAILAVLNALNGIFLLLLGIAFAVLTALGMLAFLSEFIKEIEHRMAIIIPAGVITGLLAVLVAVLIIFGLVGLVMAWGLWTGKTWAWWLTIIFNGIGALGNLGSLGLSLFRFIGMLRHPGAMIGLAVPVISHIISLGINLLIIWYFFRPHVKAFFGMGPQAPVPPPPPETV